MRRDNYLHNQPRHLTVQQQFRLILKLLRRNHPTKHPVRVRRISKDTIVRAGSRYGLAYVVNGNEPNHKRYFEIWLCNSDPWKIQLDTLLHEWAHCLTWYKCPDGKDHSDIFARKYGMLYRDMIEG